MLMFWYQHWANFLIAMERHTSIDSLSLLVSNSTQYVVFHNAMMSRGAALLTHWPFTLFYFVLHLPDVICVFTYPDTS